VVGGPIGDPAQEILEALAHRFREGVSKATEAMAEARARSQPPPLPPPHVDLSGTSRDVRIESAAAIRADTERWKQAREALQKARRAVLERGHLSAHDFSYFGVQTEALKVYTDYRSKLLDLLEEGVEVMTDIEHRLVEVSRRIELTEEENRASLEVVRHTLENERGGA
jgi:hypothetical protein